MSTWWSAVATGTTAATRSTPGTAVASVSPVLRHEHPGLGDFGAWCIGHSAPAAWPHVHVTDSRAAAATHAPIALRMVVDA